VWGLGPGGIWGFRRNTPKRYNIMAFNSADRVSLSTWAQARMERDMSNKHLRRGRSCPRSGGKKGIALREFRAEDQPWLLRVNGKGAGGSGASWFNFTPLARHRTLTAEEAEEEWERRNKVLNHFSIMQQRRLRDQDEEEEEKEKGRKAPGKGGGLRIHDLEEDLELSSEESEASEGPEMFGGIFWGVLHRTGAVFGGLTWNWGIFGGPTLKWGPFLGGPTLKWGIFGGLTLKWGIFWGSHMELGPFWGSHMELGDFGGVSRGIGAVFGGPTLKWGIFGGLTWNWGRFRGSHMELGPFSGVSHGIPPRRRRPPKRERRASGSSSRGGSRPGTPQEPGGAGGTLRAAAARLEQGGGPGEEAMRRYLSRKDPQNPKPPDSPSPCEAPRPILTLSLPLPSKVQLTEEAVRRYLSRKPMTTKDLLKKFQTKRTGLSSDATVNALAQLLKRLDPERKLIADKMHFFLKE
uniref:Transcription initiation factor IIF subunit alpha n=1 Tax=Geospiza parvula TaxID=87175 RepID=A0A8U8BQA4_GEOPR